MNFENIYLLKFFGSLVGYVGCLVDFFELDDGRVYRIWLGSEA